VRNKLKTIFKSLLICILLFGCEFKENDSINYKLNLKVEFKSNEEGLFYIIFNNIELDNDYKSSYIIKQDIKKTNTYIYKNYQLFSLKKLPNYIQIRLGTNLKTLEIKKIELTYKDNDLIIEGYDLDRYFSFTDNIIFSSKDRSISIIEGLEHKPAMIRLNPNYTKFLAR